MIARFLAAFFAGMALYALTLYVASGTGSGPLTVLVFSMGAITLGFAVAIMFSDDD